MATLPASPPASRGPSWAGKLALLALVGVVTGGAVWELGQRTREPQDGYTATAVVRLADQPSSSAEALPQEILADGFLQEALGLPSAAVATLRPSLHVAVEPAGSQWRVAVRYAGREPQATLQVVNRMTEHLASVLRSREVADMPTASNVETAQAQRQAVRAELDAFLQQHFAQLQQRAERLVSSNSSPLPSSVTAEPPAAKGSDAALVENPQWVELNDRIAQMEQDRAGLLQSRTPEHPSVRDLEQQLTRLNQQLSGLARRIPAKELPAGLTPPREAVAPPVLPAIDLHPLVQADQAAAARYAELRQGVERAELLLQQAVTAERQRQTQTTSRVQLDPAQRCEPLAAPATGDRLLWVALAAAVAMAAGVGMLWLGMIAPPLTTVADVQAALPVPILGVLSTLGTAPAASRPSRLSRSLLQLSGLTLIVVCGAMLAAFLRS